MSDSPAEPHKPEPNGPEPEKMGNLTGVLLGIIGVVAMLGGVMQLRKGIAEIGQGMQGDKHQALLVSSDKSLEEGKKLLVEVAPQFQQLLDAVGKTGLETVRQERADLANQVAAQFAKVADSFRAAAKDLDDYRQQAGAGKLDAFLMDKAAAYRRLTEAVELNQQLAQLVLDKSLVDTNAFLAKVDPLLAEREAAEKAATELSTKADEEGKQAQERK
jgi:hypothetical protein